MGIQERTQLVNLALGKELEFTFPRLADASVKVELKSSTHWMGLIRANGKDICSKIWELGLAKFRDDEMAEVHAPVGGAMKIQESKAKAPGYWSLDG